MNRLTTHDLMERWKCGYNVALAFMYRKGSGAIRIGRKIVVDEKEVIRYEESKRVRTGY
jgi:hypothetical protein